MGQVFLEKMLGISKGNLLAGTSEKSSKPVLQWSLGSIILYK